MLAEGNPSKAVDHPVGNVSWDDVQEWLAEMNTRYALPEGWKWDLPSEAQWEYACRAGTTKAFAGDLDEMAWYKKNSGNHTNPVGAKKANAWGLHDMHGNVSEWCSDYFWYYRTRSAAEPAGAASDDDRVFSGARAFRGGAVESSADNCRAAHRHGFRPGYRGFKFLGFRPALVQSTSQ